MATLVRCLSAYPPSTEVVVVGVVVPLVREPGEPGPVEVDRERVVADAEDVDPHVELAAAEEEGVEEVALADVGLGRVVAVVGLPARHLPDLVDDEDALALALRGLNRGSRTGFIIQRDLLSCCVFLNSS